MLAAVRGLLVLTVIAVASAAPAVAQPSSPVAIAVTLTADQPVVTVDLDAPRDQVVHYEVVVANEGDDLVPGVVVEAGLPGGPVRRVVGDLAPRSEWRAILDATVRASTTGGGPVDSVATARAADGRTATSAPARVDVQVISSAVVVRDDATPPAETPSSTTVPADVLGATYQQPLDTTLARTGIAAGVLCASGAALVLFGGLLVRRTARAG